MWARPVRKSKDGGDVEPRKVKEWNTKNLGQRLSVDLMAASSAGILVAPIITVIGRFVLCSIRTLSLNWSIFAVLITEHLASTAS